MSDEELLFDLANKILQIQKPKVEKKVAFTDDIMYKLKDISIMIKNEFEIINYTELGTMNGWDENPPEWVKCASLGHRKISSDDMGVTTFRCKICKIKYHTSD